MLNNNRYIRHSIVVFVLMLIPSFYYLIKQGQENRIVNSYLVEKNLRLLPISRESAFNVARQFALDFNVNQESFKVLDMDQRPFLREDAGVLLSYKEGLCGEGSRVIIRLLNTCGYDATRITLYDKYMQHAHTLVSVKMDGKEFWINSINSTDSLTRLLENKSISIENFEYLVYSDNIEDRLKKNQLHRDIESSDDFEKNLGQYFLFSYEAIPLTKILNIVGVKMRVFNFERPPHFISVVAEEPNMIMFLCYLLFAIVLTIFVLVIGKRVGRRSR